MIFGFLRHHLIALRVRHHGEVARIEVPLAHLPRLREAVPRVTAALVALGFREITVDPRGLRSGALAREALHAQGEAAGLGAGAAGPGRSAGPAGTRL